MKNIIIISCAFILCAFSRQEDIPRFPWVQDGKLCYIQANGVVISTDENTLQYSDIQQPKHELKTFKQTGMTGFEDADGKVVIKPGYEAAGQFVGGLAWVKIDYKRYYYINQSEQPLLNYSFDRCYDFQDGMGRVLDKNLAKGYVGYGFLDTKGAIRIPLIFKDATDFVGGYALVKDDAGAWFLINKNGEKIQGPNYELKRIKGDTFGR